MVHLRRPRLYDPEDTRRDPFWEFGSFGLTGCHRRNIMHPRRTGDVRGCRLAFAQGGQSGMRLVYLTPPVTIIRHKNVVEARWEPSPPFRYTAAPLLINMHGETDFPLLKRAIRDTRRAAWTSRFSSRYRSSCSPLSRKIAAEIVEKFTSAYLATNEQHARTYEETLPFLPRRVDRSRHDTYRALLAKAIT